MLGMDKLMHFGVCFLTVLLVGVIDFKFAIGLAFGLAVGKEVGDYFNPNSNGYVYDLIADVCGIATAILIWVLILK